jgi:hypothetical protein
MNPQRKQGISPRAASPAALPLRAGLKKSPRPRSRRVWCSHPPKWARRAPVEQPVGAEHPRYGEENRCAKIGGGILRTCSLARNFEDVQK